MYDFSLDPLSDDDVATVARRVLTPKQLETWRLSCMGMSNKRIARVQGVSANAVRNSLDRSYAKLRQAGVKITNKRWHVGEEPDAGLS